MITNAVLSLPADPDDLSFSAGDYPDLEQRIEHIGGEFLLIRHEESDFYFLCSDDCDIAHICRTYDWHIVSSGHFNDRLRIGMGLSDKADYDCELYRVQDEDTLRMWHDILRFVFLSGSVRKFFPFTNRFRGKLRLDGALCFYLHDYSPVSHTATRTTSQKKVANLVFRFKEGACAPLAAKLFALAISRMAWFGELNDPVLIPVPASTRERHRLRFASFCSQLARRLNIEDGYRAVWIEQDREQQKGNPLPRDLKGVRFNRRYIAGKDVLLVDDILTTGGSFIAVKRRLMASGAASVTGIFLARTL